MVKPKAVEPRKFFLGAEGAGSATGTIHQVVVDVGGELIEDDDATMRRLMAQQ